MKKIKYKGIKRKVYVFLKELKVSKTAGFTLIELIFVIIIGLGLIAGAFFAGPKALEKAKVFNLRRNIASLETVATQLMYETDGLSNLSDDSEFITVFNRYIDSNASLDASGQLRLKDPWGMGFYVTHRKISGAESTILVESKGKYGGDRPSHALLIHYKDGEVRAGTSGFDTNVGVDTSDASFSDSAGASITTLFAN